MIDFIRWLLSPLVIKIINEEQEKTMSAINDLKLAVEALQQESSSIRSLVADLYAKVGPLTLSQAELAAINPELAKLAELLTVETQKLADAQFPTTPTP